MSQKQFIPELISKHLTDEQADVRGVMAFSQAMTAKLTECRKRGKGNWHKLNTVDPMTQKPNTVERFKKEIQMALNEGRMVDIANYAMMVYHREKMSNE